MRSESAASTADPPDAAAPASAEARARDVLAEAAARGIPPEPRAFALLWAWFDGDDPDLAAAVAAELAPGAADAPEAVARLWARHVANPEPTSEMLRLGDLIGAELDAVAATLARRTAADDEVVDRLARAREDLPLLAGPTALRKVLRELTEIAERQAEQSALFAGELEVARLQISELRKELGDAQEIASRDALTGLANRRRFDATLARAVAEAAAGGPGFALVLADLDRFKRINDAYGHPVGDSVLRHFADGLRPAMRAGDLAARYGGEEFALILPRADALAARHVAERIRQDFAARSFAVRGGGPRLGALSASFGVAEHRPEEGVEDVVARADAALYRAKNGGRNRVCVAE